MSFQFSVELIAEIRNAAIEELQRLQREAGAGKHFLAILVVIHVPANGIPYITTCVVLIGPSLSSKLQLANSGHLELESHSNFDVAR